MQALQRQRQLKLVARKMLRSTVSWRTLSSFSSVNSIPWNVHADVKGPFGAYKEQYEFALRDPESYWKAAADKLEWFQKPSTILDYNAETNPHFPRWFADGRINMSYNCLDVHVNEGRADQDALIYDSPVTGVKERYTYQQLLTEVSTFAGAMQDLGVEKGDRVGMCI